MKENPYVDENERAEQIIQKTIYRVDRRNEVGLPWKEENTELPTNYGLALGRLKSGWQKLCNQPKLKEAYSAAKDSQLKNGVTEIVDVKKPAEKVHYIPHHWMLKPDKATTKVRVAFDASAKTKKSHLSLNEALLRGPVSLQDLCGLLLRFRRQRSQSCATLRRHFIKSG